MQIDDPFTAYVREHEDAGCDGFFDDECDSASVDDGDSDGQGSPTPVRRRTTSATAARTNDTNGLALARDEVIDSPTKRRRMGTPPRGTPSPNPGAAARRAALMAMHTAPETPSKGIGRISLHDTPVTGMTSLGEGANAADVVRTPTKSPSRAGASPTRFNPLNCTPAQRKRYLAVEQGIRSRETNGTAAPSEHAAPMRDLAFLGVPRNLTSEFQAAQSPKSERVARQWDLARPMPALPDSDALVHVVPACPFQPALDGVLYGVQWELARLLSSHGDSMWDCLNAADVARLRGAAAHAAMPQVADLLNAALSREGESGDVPFRALAPSSVWTEMDREEHAIAANDMSGVFNASDDAVKWPYGGKLVYAVSVQFTRNRFTFTLLPIDAPTKSTRIARRLGSRRILTLRFKDVPRGKRPQLVELLCGRVLVLFGRAFRVLWIPPDSDHAIAVQTSDAPGLPTTEPVLPFRELVEGYNDMAAKPRQAMAKWAARTQLLQSDSVPTCIVPLHAVAEVDDIVCCGAGPNPPSAKILTDGCGLMSAKLARSIMLHANFTHLTTRPCSVQMRYGGSKGLLVLMNDEQQREYAGKDIVLRDSMIKSRPSAWFADDVSLTTLDVLKVGSLKFGVNISSEPLIVMAHNGVQHSAIVSKVQQGIEAIGRDFNPQPGMDESDDAALFRVMRATFRHGGLAAEQRKREVSSKGQSLKAAGLVWRGNGANDAPCEDKEEIVTTAERLYRLLRAGFKPIPGRDGCAYAATQLRSFVRMLTNRAVKEYKIPVEQSLTGFIVPDPLGLLKPHEIFVAPSTEQPLDPETFQSMPYLLGECLVYRSPCKLPTDVRKVEAVYHPELAYLRDCIVFSANADLCTVSPASMLGGGDYDGDTATVIWDKALVEPFVNAPDELATPPADFEAKNFTKDVVRVDQFMAAVEGSGDAAWVRNAQHFLLASALDEQLTGIYSGLHDVSVYMNGRFDGRADGRFCHVLDARKNGLCVRPRVRRDDMAAGNMVVAWRETKAGKGERQDNVTVAVRPAHKARFIMDVLGDAAGAAQAAVLALFPDPRSAPACQELAVLAAPYRAACAAAAAAAADAAGGDKRDARLRAQLDRLGAHVAAVAAVLPMVYRGTCDIPAAYAAHLPRASAPEEPMELGASRTPSRTPSRSPTRPSSPARTNGAPTNGSGSWHAAHVVRARMRDLCAIWRDALRPADVPDLAPFGCARFLAELKVACAVHLAVSRSYAVKLPFEVDFETTCSMMAEACSGGVTCSMPAATAARLRPMNA